MKLTIINKVTLSILLIISFLLNPKDLFSQGIKKVKENYKNGVQIITETYYGNDLKLEYRGEITLSNDDKDIAAISRGGFIEIRKSRFGKRRRITIKSEGGRLVKKYFVGYKEKPFNLDAKNWLADILQDLVEKRAIGAESRVERFYKKGGAKAVLNEVKRMDSDYTKGVYMQILSKKKLSSNELLSAVKTCVKEIKSDRELSSVLVSYSKQVKKSSQKVKDAYIIAAKTIKHNFDFGRAMRALD